MTLTPPGKPSSHFSVQPAKAPLSGRIRVPGDKSLSHRAVLLGMLADGTTRARGWLSAGDTEASLRAAQALGVTIERPAPGELHIHGGALRAPSAPLDLVNAGTGFRLLAGILAGQPFASTLDGSAQLRRRPMRRIIQPLAMMGAHITHTDERAPLSFRPSPLRGIKYDMPIASAQVKSAVLLAGLFTGGVTAVTQPGPARDHTERMLAAMGADLDLGHNIAVIRAGQPLRPLDLTVPGDASSAAFVVAAALLVPGSAVTITGVNLNPTRTGLLDVLAAMGADITVTKTGDEGGEPVGEVHVRHSVLRGTSIGGEVVVRMIDEFPVLMVLALAAEGRTVVREAQELRVKETDRIRTMASELGRLGAHVHETPDGFIVDGPQALAHGTVDGHDDHRIAMSMAVAGLVAAGPVTVTDAACAHDSFPGFADVLAGVGAPIREEANPQADPQPHDSHA